MNKRLTILLRLADLPSPTYGLTIAELAHGTPWVSAALYGDIYALEQAGLVAVNRQAYPMLIGFIQHPDLAAMHPDVTVPDDQGS